MKGTWRDMCRPIIAKVISEVGKEDKKALRVALREAYPFGDRRYWPYKVWLDEIKVQLGKRKYGARRPAPVPKEQMSLFEGDKHEANKQA